MKQAGHKKTEHEHLQNTCLQVMFIISFNPTALSPSVTILYDNIWSWDADGLFYKQKAYQK